MNPEIASRKRHFTITMNWYEKSKLAGRFRKINNEEKTRIYEFRDNPTEAEFALWNILRKKQILGLKFRRQHKIGQFIVDFYCHEAGLVIEADGKIHDKRATEDAVRTKWLESIGLHVIRFKNDVILSQPEKIKTEITSYIESNHSKIAEFSSSAPSGG
jgi:very-short-patch-repair endonuclease